MNIRKNIDHCTMYARINDAMQTELSQMERYFTIRRPLQNARRRGPLLLRRSTSRRTGRM